MMLLYEYVRLGRIGNMTADGRLYLSIADNFLSSGHFIQTARWFPGMVVPPIVPATVTILRLLGFTADTLCLFHAVLFGLSHVMLGETEWRLTGRCGLASLVYCLAYARCRLLLGNLLVEHYYLFLICTLLWLLFCPIKPGRKILEMNFVGLLLFMTRPAMAPAYLLVLSGTLCYSWRNRLLRQGTAILLLPAILLTFNMWVNYRETGEIILLESYSGTDLYITACENAPVTREEWAVYENETRDSVFFAKELTMSQKSAILNSLSRAYVREHFGTYLYKSLQRFFDIFGRAYLFLPVIPAAGGVLFARSRKNRGERMLHYSIWGVNVLLALLTSFGIPEIRYTAVIWPVASLHCAEAADWCRKLCHRHPAV